jgi:transposase
MSTDAASSTTPVNAAAVKLPPLPDDLEHLKAMIRELLVTLHQQRHENESLRHRLDELLRRLYGPRTEQVNPDQLVLFAELLQPPPDAEPRPEEPEPRSEPAPPKRKGHGRRRPTDQLPRQRVLHDVPEAERLCPCCGKPRLPAGERVTTQLDFKPALFFLWEHVYPAYACSACEGGHVVTAERVSRPIARGWPGPGLLAYLITSKFFDHLPLYRLERIFERHGYRLERSTTCDWMAGCARLLEPLCAEMRKRVLAGRVIGTDDTPMPVLDNDRDRTRLGRLWGYLGDREHPYNVFDYTPDRTRTGPRAFLADYRGYLVADAFSGYDGIYLDSRGTIVEVCCNAHARRKFFNARKTDAARSHQALAYYRQLYAVEAEAKNLDDDSRLSLRQEKSLPLLADFERWLRQHQAAVLPKSPIGEAIAYALNHWTALVRYTEAGFLPIDNNQVEREMKRIATGRKNYLFVGSDQGGKTAAILYSFTSTCARHGLDPFAYLRDVLARLPDHPSERLAELLPNHWAAARASPTEPDPTAR